LTPPTSRKSKAPGGSAKHILAAMAIMDTKINNPALFISPPTSPAYLYYNYSAKTYFFKCIHCLCILLQYIEYTLFVKPLNNLQNKKI
jgi:hypothetical protein